MGTHACTRIQKNGDFIEMYTRWDGFPEEIKNDLKNSVSNWSQLVEYLQEKNKNYCFSHVSEWLIEMKEFISQVKDNPSIEQYAALLCSKSLTHHHVMLAPNKASKEMLDYWGHGYPDVIANLDEGIQFNKRKKVNLNKIQPKAVDSQYTILRLVDVDKSFDKVNFQNEQEFSYIDLKINGMTHDQITQLIFELPLFWLEMHTLARDKNPSHQKQEDIELIGTFYNYKFESFFSPGKEYAQFPRRAGEINSYENILDMVCATIPFDFGSNALATHLYLASAGKILPLTQAEQLWASKQNSDQFIQVSICPDSERTSIVTIEQNQFVVGKDLLQEKINILYKRFDETAQKLIPNFSFDHKPQFMLMEDGSIGFNYEKNMIAFFHLLTVHDHGLNSKNKMKIK